MYLRDRCCPTPGTRGRSSLRSLEQGLLFVPFARTSTTQARALSVVGPSVWNGLPLSQRSLPSHPGPQRLQFAPIIGTGVTLCSFCSYIHNPGPCIVGGWSLCVEWASVVAKIFAIPPRPPEVAVRSDHRNRGYSLFLLLVHPQPRPVHCRWLVPLCGMGFRCRKDLSHPTPPTQYSS